MGTLLPLLYGLAAAADALDVAAADQHKQEGLASQPGPVDSILELGQLLPPLCGHEV